MCVGCTYLKHATIYPVNESKEHVNWKYHRKCHLICGPQNHPHRLLPPEGGGLCKDNGGRSPTCHHI